MRIHQSILVAALVMTSASVFATSGHEDNDDAGMKAGMKGCEQMHGGKMTPDEHRKHADGMFKKLDANADGTITRAEFDAHHEAMMKQPTPDGDGHAGHQRK